MNEHRIRPIHSDEDYTAALARVEALMDLDRTQSQDDELDILATLIEVFEDRQFPMDQPDPIEAIKFRMEQMDIKQSDLAPIFGSRSKASEVLSGKRSLTLKMIRALNEHLGIPADVLIRDGNGLPNTLDEIDIEQFPLVQMAKLGWIEKSADIKDRAEEIVQRLVACVGGQQALPQALFRQGGGARANAKTDVHALQAWCLHILCKARNAGLEGVFQPGTITLDFLREIACLSEFDEGPKLAKEKLAKHGVALVVASHLPKTYLDGAALWTVDGVPVVGMTIRYDRLDNFWFCLLHELAHLGRHFTNGDSEVFIDDLQLRERNHERDDEREREADEWAQEALVPSDLWLDHPVRSRPSVQNVLSLSRQAKVHPAIIAGRIRHEMKNYRLLSQFVGAKQVRPLLMEDAA
ncbi:ImmA/IrrE family metallo-endopeptidase [Rhodobacteraceae bacterium B1Z28]|uniref:ImmA/IrrE family metallo-endopeptidase n=1 Tax=Ruegeria haliotis TaxID=2747601 RepID=A0ABX2PSH2_9RHOB|nr:ImmA/IrrE family metallo-endopeptidase [Ruegeria haliotis]NVO56014.1 ImmA/IrrE family metallo-endopeptidase [Ruegeria haliotis]